MLAGEEMARSKDGDHNSYKSSVEINQIDWGSLTKYGDLVKYYKGLIDLRKAYAPFTCDDNTAIDTLSFYKETDKHLLGYMYQNPDADKQWDKVICLINSGDNAEVKLEGENLPNDWVVVANADSAGVEKLYELSGDTVSVKAREALILVDKASFEKASLTAEKTSVDSLPDTVLATQLAQSVADKGKENEKNAAPYIMGVLGALITGAGIAYLVRRWRKNRNN